MAAATLGLVVRVSRVGKRKEKGERFVSPREQVREGTRLAETAGYGVKVFDDANVSGATPFEERPGMGAALRELDEGRLAGLVTAYRDRLVRQDAAKGVTLAALQERIRRAGGVLLVGDTPDACIGRPGDRVPEGLSALGLDVLVALDGRYREESRKRWRSANRDAIERGVQPGRTPSWLHRRKDGRFEPNEHTPAVVKAVELRASGASWAEVAELLNVRGVPTHAGGGWSYKTAERLCRCELLVGCVSWGPYRNEKAFEPLVDEATFLLASRRKERPKGYRDREPGLATGVVVCAECGGRMIQDRTKRRDGGQTDFYRCRSGVCEAPASITHARLEPFLWDAAAAEADRRMQREALEDSAPAANGGPSPEELREALRGAETEVAEFLRRVKPTTPGFSEALEALEADVETARDRLAVSAAPRERTMLEVFEESERDWNNPAWRRALVASVVREVRVTKANRLAPGKKRVPVEDRVEIVWKEAA